ncbi:MAG: hypothetical protein HQL19_08355, partial [Candidatus Omnitrophica bacterium]|nr:hypothetical protein [Candidatus Omnitrophota bacterium]
MKRFLLLVSCFLMSGCTILEATGEAVGVVGKAGWTAAKTVGGVVYTGTSMAGQTANQTHKTLSRPSVARAHAKMAGDSVVIPLEKEGNSFYVRVMLNGKVEGR